MGGDSVRKAVGVLSTYPVAFPVRVQRRGEFWKGFMPPHGSLCT